MLLRQPTNQKHPTLNFKRTSGSDGWCYLTNTNPTLECGLLFFCQCEKNEITVDNGQLHKASERLFMFRWAARRVGLSIFSQDHDKMVGEHSLLQAEMRIEVLQLESMSSNKAQKPLIPLRIELWRYILRVLMGRECP